jgi:hypothetical protein
MSKSQAIAAVTSMLAHQVGVSTGADVKIGRPTIPEGNDAPPRKVQLFLYQVTPNAALRNVDLPTRDTAGQRVMQRPQIALDLHYLFSFYGDDEKLEPQLLMGQVMRDIHARPILTRQVIATIINNIGDAERKQIIEDSEIGNSIELVKFAPSVLSLDDMFKLWSVFSQTPYVLSVAYQATVLLIEAEETAQSALPVLQRGKDDRGVETLLAPFPIIEEVYFGLPADKDAVPRPLSYPSAKLDSVLILKGQNLGGDEVRVRFTHQRLTIVRDELIAADDVTGEEIKVTIPSVPATANTDWAAGLYSVKVFIKRGSDDKEYTSNEVPIAFSPEVTTIAPPNPIAPDGSGDVTLVITCKPEVLPEQSAVLLLADREVSAEAHNVSTDQLTFVITNAPLVTDAVLRLRVDGVDSTPYERKDNPPRLVFADNQKVTIQ